MTWPVSPAPHDPREGGGESEDPSSPAALAAVVGRAQHASDALQPDAPGPVVVLPPDLDVEDRVLGPLTARQLGYAAVGAAGLAVMVLTPWPARPAGLVLAAIGLAGVLLRPDGLSIELWLGHVLTYHRRVRTQAREDRDGQERRTWDVCDAPDSLDDLGPGTPGAEVKGAVVAVGRDREPAVQGGHAGRRRQRGQGDGARDADMPRRVAPDEQSPLAEVASLGETAGAAAQATPMLLEVAPRTRRRRPVVLVAVGLLLVSAVAGAVQLRDVIAPASSVGTVPRSGTAGGAGPGTTAPNSPGPAGSVSGPSGPAGAVSPGPGVDPLTAGPQPFPSITGMDSDALLEELLTALDP